MRESTKENITIVFLLIAAFLMLALICFSATGCAHQPAVSPDSYFERASVISDRIEDKAVIVQEWLKSH